MSYDNESDCGGDDDADEIDNNDYYMFYMLYIIYKGMRSRLCKSSGILKKYYYYFYDFFIIFYRIEYRTKKHVVA
jgi:hypothetical protein